MPLEAGGEPLLAEHLQRFVQPEHQRNRRRPGGLVLALVVALALQIEVEARQVGRLVHLPGLLARGEEGEPGRQSQRLLRSGHHYVDAPGIERQVERAERADRVDHEDRVPLLRDARKLFDRVPDAGGRFVRLHEDAFGVGMFAERRFDGARVDRASPFHLQHHGVHAVALGELRPALAELSRVDDDRLVTAAQEVDQRGFHGAGAAGGELHHVLSRLEQPGKAFADAREDLLELGRAVVDHRLRHPQREPLGNRRRTWGEKADLLHRRSSSRCAGVG